MSRVVTRIGPADHGRRMRLEEFDQAEAAPGHLYELSRGVVTVVDVPKKKHLAQVTFIRKQLTLYDAENPSVIHTVAGSRECKILLTDLQSERHPDLAIYKTAPGSD